MYQRLVTRTIVGAELQTSMMMGLPYTVRPNTSLNQKLDILANQPHAPNTYPRAAYLAIGCGAHESIPGADGKPGRTNVIKHRPTDTGLFQQVPWVLRLTTNDLPVEQQAKYGLRKQIEHEGRLYFAYYLKRLDLTNVVTELQSVTIRNGDKNVVPWIPNNSNLNPTVPYVSPDQSVPTLVNGDYTTCIAVVTVELTPLDVTEFVNAAIILFGDETYAVISEVAYVSGQDRTTVVPDGTGTNINFKEVVSAQVMQFVSQYVPMAFASQGVTLTLNVGSSEALLTEVQPSMSPTIIT